MLIMINILKMNEWTTIVKKKENQLNSELCHSGWPQSKTERKWKERYVHRPC